MISARGVRRSLGGRLVVDDVSLSVAPGQVVGLLGPNGAGKTTTIRLLLGLLRAHRGEVAVDGPVGWLPERFAAYDGLSVVGYLRFVARAKGAGGSAGGRRVEVERVVAAAGLEGLERRPVGRLSKGQRQRLGFAQALLGPPRSLVLDEPTTSLDPAQVVTARRLIADAAGAGAAVLLSTHLLAEAAAVCDRVVVLAGGRVVGEEATTSAAALEARFLHLVGATELGLGSAPAAGERTAPEAV